MNNDVTEVRQPPPIPEFEVPAEDQQPDRPGPGSVLGNYRLEQKLASGASGEVFAGLNLLAKKPCIIKVFHQSLDIGQVAFGRYVHEVTQACDGTSPALAEVFFNGLAQGHYFTVYGPALGEPLRGVVRKNAPLSRRVVMPLVRELGVGLLSLHQAGLVHGRLHGGQVLVQWSEERPRIQLLDVGLHHLLPAAKDAAAERSRRADHAIYTPPEVIKGEETSPATDIYSLSVMIYEMVTGKVPFLGETYEATLEQHLNEEPLPPGQLLAMPAQMEETILRGLTKDPRQRIRSVEALLSALDPRGLTGKHLTPSAASRVTGRHRNLAVGLDPDSGSLDLTPLAPGPDATAEADDMEQVVRGNRKWLLVAAAVVIVGCLVALALVFFGGDDKKKSKKSKGSQPTAAAASVPSKQPVPPAPAPKAKPRAPDKPAPATRPAPDKPAPATRPTPDKAASDRPSTPPPTAAPAPAPAGTAEPKEEARKTPPPAPMRATSPNQARLRNIAATGGGIVVRPEVLRPGVKR